jgi:DNA modification methylase
MGRVEHIGDATLYLGDCLDIMPTLGAFDAVVTDPPYGLGESSKKVASRVGLAALKDYGDFNWDSKPASDAAIDALREASRHQIIFGGNYFTLPPTSCWLVWDKKNGKTDFADCELAWTNLAKAVRRIEWLWNGMIRKGDDVRQHPTQKPVGVMEWCIGHLPASTETILDPFMGSGTTGVACAKMGRKFTGIELDEGYFDIACRRIEEAYSQPDMFVEPPKPAKQETLEL